MGGLKSVQLTVHFLSRELERFRLWYTIFMIVYTTEVDSISPKQLKGFFVGWEKHPTVERHLDILKGSDEVFLALDNETDNVIGFITAITDGVLSAYIPLLEVLPNYQHKGIGNELVTQMLDKLKMFYMVDLLCDSDLQDFYTGLGMQKTSGMELRNYKHQRGE